MTSTTVDKEAWIAVQKKTFTKWMNNHLRKKGFDPIDDAFVEFETGVKLMHLINSLYDVKIPRHRARPKMRPMKLDNIAMALKMVDKAEIKTNFLKPGHLVDHDVKMILGMIWAIILDYQIKGISVDELTAKEGLLMWCRKKTKGYRDVCPPSLNNFTTDWQNGLAFCALIHRHRPDLLNYDDLNKENAAENLELAFKIAEDDLDIPRLLDVEDIVGVSRPDERSIMTYVSEFFHCFAGMDKKETAARRVAKFLAFARSMEELENDYERRAAALLCWVEGKTAEFSSPAHGTTLEAAKAAFESIKSFVTGEKPGKLGEKLDLEALFADIQTQLKVNDRNPYSPPANLTPDAIDDLFVKLDATEKSYSRAVRDHRFTFIQKTDMGVSAAQLTEFEESFDHFDSDNDGQLDRVEFKAACSAIGTSFSSDDEFNRVLTSITGSAANPVTKEQFIDYLKSQQEDKDTPDQIKESFRSLADGGDVVRKNQLNMHPLTADDGEYLSSKMPASGDGAYDYNSYVDANFH
eukprot:TRINITY_DN96_c0_g1_i1.p1 TRINITY_DN96_c0_g1~~TRINITY_DN96_c0_g1_i1.p1  ORF type:complete len:543 (-),score=221.77 TRINITY_DN96_c0_g1_i1:203-1768(-)